MVTVVVILNLLITLLCLYVAWRMWQLRRVLAKATDALIAAEHSTHKVLNDAPEFVLRGQTGVAHLRKQYLRAAVQLQKAQQILTLLGLGQFVWKRYGRFIAPRNTRTTTARRVSVRQVIQRFAKIP